MTECFELVLGTRNRKKRRELETLLDGIPVQVRTLDEFPNSLEVAETGQTFEENARLKATVQAIQLGKWVMGEDSGLSVDALDGAPGVWSARFAGEDASDADNNSRLVEDLKSVPLMQRTAHYTCHITLSDPQGRPVIDVEGYCRGRIALKPSGSAGFGYDPWFELVEYHQTFAELGDTVKSVLSHRGRAMREFLRQLQPVIRSASQPVS